MASGESDGLLDAARCGTSERRKNLMILITNYGLLFF